MSSYKDLGIPESDATVDVKLFDLAGHFEEMKSPAGRFYQPILPGRENMQCTLFAFLIERPSTKERVMFDLGPRKDMENAAPMLAAAFKSGDFNFRVESDIVDQLEEAGVPLETIKSVIWSHTHFDHVGDMSKWPSSTELVISAETEKALWSENPESTLLASDFSGHNIIEIAFEDSKLEIGGFRAVDYFGDGSFYLLDVPGHALGHTAGLARVTPTTFILLGADTCHHPGLLRPTASLHQHFPCPGALALAASRSVSSKHFPPTNREPKEGELFNIHARTKPMLDIPPAGVVAYFADPIQSRLSIQKFTVFDTNPDVLVLIAHDSSLDGIVEMYPATLNSWKEKGWKEKGMWAFLDEKNRAFRFSPL